MDNFGFNEMQNIQRELQAKYADKWKPLTPALARDKLLWMMIEVGEVADVIKKKGDDAIVENAEVRHDFTEELCDVLMYLNDVMLCYGITPEELQTIYLEKHKRNMGRW
jgi:NTP pyrophosphatase (non-canonical NTP hydrolase)